jgi:DnaJ-domain-containing protein 1
MVVMAVGDIWEALDRAALRARLFELGRTAATGALTLVAPENRGEVLALRRGSVISADGPASSAARLARIACLEGASARFSADVSTFPPGAAGQLPLVAWLQAHFEAQLDARGANEWLSELSGRRLALRPEARPEAPGPAEHRMLDALSARRRIEQLWPLARVPRLRLLGYLHFLAAVGALDIEGPALSLSSSITTEEEARRVLGLGERHDARSVKAAYRRLARELHPDLLGDLDDNLRRNHERRLAEVTTAYELLR